MEIYCTPIVIALIIIVVLLLLSSSRYKLKGTEGFYPGNYCPNCGYQSRLSCRQCSNCGFSIGLSGQGSCIPGTSAGPLFNQDTVLWEYGNLNSYYDYPYDYPYYYENLYNGYPYYNYRTVSTPVHRAPATRRITKEPSRHPPVQQRRDRH